MSNFRLEASSLSCVPALGEPALRYVGESVLKKGKMARLPHSHSDYLEIVYISEGRTAHRVGNERCFAQSGDVLLFNEGVVHDSEAAGEADARIISIGCTGLALEGLPGNHMAGPGQGALVHTDSYAHEFAVLFELLLRQLKNEAGETASPLCNAALLTLLELIRQLLSRQEGKEPAPAHDLVDSMKAYIDQNYAEALTLGAIAEAFYINPFYASHVFKEVMGDSPIKYLTQRRIGEAQTLLIFTQDSITHIAAQVGYDNPNYFSTVFAKLVGMSPVQYRGLWTGKEGG